MRYRDRLLGSLRVMQPILDIPGVMVAGSQVPNLLERDAASTLVISEDVDLVIPVSRHLEVKAALERINGFSPASDDPSVWLADDRVNLEVNFIGLDRTIAEATDTYVFEDDRLPLLVFGLLSHLQEGVSLDVDGIRIPLPRPAGLLVEKLLTERPGVKGERDLLVAAGLLEVSSGEDAREMTEILATLSSEERQSVLSNLTILSLMKPIPGMPDPVQSRSAIAELLRNLEAFS